MLWQSSAGVVFVLGLVLHAGISGALALPVISVEPARLTVQPLESVAVEVRITDVLDLHGFQFDLMFNPNVLTFTDVQEGPFLPSGGPTLPSMPVDTGLGILTFADILQGGGVNGSGLLATIIFAGLDSGSSQVKFTDVILLDSLGADIAFSIAAVPEPSTVVLLSTGLLGLIGYGCRQRRQP